MRTSIWAENSRKAVLFEGIVGRKEMTSGNYRVLLGGGNENICKIYCD